MTWQIYTKEIKLPYKKRIIIHIFPIKIKLYYNKMTRHVYTNLKVYHFLIKKCTTPNRLRRYA